MNRSWFGGILLALLLTVSGLTGNALDRDLAPVEENLEICRREAEAGNWDQARGSLGLAGQEWEKCRNLCAAVLDRGAAAELDGSFRRMESLGNTGSRPEFAATCAEASGLIRDFRESTEVTLQNLL